MKTIYVIGIGFSDGDIRIFFLQFKVILEGAILDAGYQRNRAFLGQNWKTHHLYFGAWKLKTVKRETHFMIFILVPHKTEEEKLKYKTENEKLTMWLLVCCLKEPVLTKSRTRSRPRSWRGIKVNPLRKSKRMETTLCRRPIQKTILKFLKGIIWQLIPALKSINCKHIPQQQVLQTISFSAELLNWK